MKENKTYTKSLEDEIDWKVIDQLHTATVNFTSTGLELKKLFFVLVGIAVPSLIKLAGDKLDLSFFVTIYLLTLTFWALDSFTYFYQEKLREKMNALFNQIRIRNKESLIVPDSIKHEFTLESARTNKDRVWRSISNLSLGIYMAIFVLNTIGFLLFKGGLIK